MKIWIQSTPRSGSTSFYGALSNLLQLEWEAEEPFNMKLIKEHPKRYPQTFGEFYLKPTTENFIVKNQIWHWPDDLVKNSPFELKNNTWYKSNSFDEYVEFHKKIRKVISHPILLGRKSVRDSAISLFHANKNNNWTNNYILSNDSIDSYWIDYATFQKNVLIELAETVYKKDIIWYEDVFSEDENIRRTILKKINLYKFLSLAQVRNYVKNTNPINRYQKKKNPYNI